VTIIVEGGLGTLEVLENDIENKRPIVLIQVIRSNQFFCERPIEKYFYYIG
jgi:hypothetical protein